GCCERHRCARDRCSAGRGAGRGHAQDRAATRTRGQLRKRSQALLLGINNLRRIKSPLSDKNRGVRQNCFQVVPHILMAYPFASTAWPKQLPTASKYRSAIVDGTESRQRTIGSA